MIERLPVSVRAPQVARAVVSPSAIVLAGIGAAAVVATGLPLVLAPLAAVGGWLARVMMAVPRGSKEDIIDPFGVGDPWRRFVQDAQQAKSRFDRTVDRTNVGPLRDRLAELGSRIDDGVRESWRVAQQGDALEAAYTQLDVRGIHQELARVDDEGGSPEARARTRQALESQLASAERIASVARQARDRLRVLTAQLDEAVARAVELSVSSGDAAAVRPLSDDVENLVGELESVRQGLEEVSPATG